MVAYTKYQIWAYMKGESKREVELKGKEMSSVEGGGREKEEEELWNRIAREKDSYIYGWSHPEYLKINLEYRVAISPIQEI